jgi:hypothetical protein
MNHCMNYNELCCDLNLRFILELMSKVVKLPRLKENIPFECDMNQTKFENLCDVQLYATILQN